MTPCESWPRRFARTSSIAIQSASSRGTWRAAKISAVSRSSSAAGTIGIGRYTTRRDAGRKGPGVETLGPRVEWVPVGPACPCTARWAARAPGCSPPRCARASPTCRSRTRAGSPIPTSARVSSTAPPRDRGGIACRLGGRDRSVRSARRPQGPRPHARARGPVLHAPARRPRRRRRQDRAARGRRHAPRLRPARARARGSGDVLRAHQRGQAQRGARSHAPGGASGRARSRQGERRGGRELRAGRGRAARLRPRHAGGGEAGPRLLLDLGLRPVGAVADAAGVGAPALWARLLAAMKRPDLGQDPRFATPLARRQNWAELRPFIVAWVDAFPSAQAALEACTAARIPAAPVLTPAEVIAHPHLVEREFFPAVPHPAREGVRVTGVPFVVDGRRPAPAGPAPYRPGEHTREVLSGLLGYDAQKIEALRKAGAIETV